MNLAREIIAKASDEHTAPPPAPDESQHANSFIGCYFQRVGIARTVSGGVTRWACVVVG
jgi:hypothetical protein